LRGFERGIFSVGSVLGASVAAVGLAVATGILIDLRQGATRKRALLATTIVGAGLLFAAVTQLHVFVDASEDRRNSFSPADAATLSELPERLNVVVRLAPEDPRYIDFERNILSKLQRTMPDVKIVLESQTRTGAFEEPSEKYGTIVYEYGGRRAESRSTGTGEILPLIYGLARVTRKAIPPAAPYPGYPLEVGTRAAGIWFYGALPLLILAAWFFAQSGFRFAHAIRGAGNTETRSVDEGRNAKET
jgi:ABC-2 type transport system permease protein